MSMSRFLKVVITGGIVALAGALSACGNTLGSHNVSSSSKVPATTVPSLLASLKLSKMHHGCSPSAVPTPTYTIPWNRLRYTTVHPPTTGVSTRVWAYFHDVNHRQYAQAVLSVDPLLRSMDSAKHYIYLRDEAHWTFIEMANITPYTPPTKDTAGAYKSRVYYVAVVLKRSGIVPCNQTGYRSGLIQFAIYMEQKTPHSPLVTVLQEFSPSNPHLASVQG
jgi:hypothetical protein